MSSGTTENAEDLFAEASKAADVLYDIRDTYYPTNPDDKTSKLLTESNLALQMLDKIPPGFIVQSPIILGTSFWI